MDEVLSSLFTRGEFVEFWVFLFLFLSTFFAFPFAVPLVVSMYPLPQPTCEF